MLRRHINGLKVGTLDSTGIIQILGMQHMSLSTRVEGCTIGKVVYVVKYQILKDKMLRYNLQIRYWPGAIYVGPEIGTWAHRQI